jgi:hypothetical protein
VTDLVASTPPRSRLSLRVVLEWAVVVVFALLIWNNYTLRRQQVRAAAATPRQAFAARDVFRALPVVDTTGRESVLELAHGRAVVAIVDPRCESCRELIAQLRGTRAHVISLAPMAETRKMNVPAYVARAPLPPEVERQLQIYPQLFVVDRGKVVRTCATVAECR